MDWLHFLTTLAATGRERPDHFPTHLQAHYIDHVLANYHYLLYPALFY